VYIPGVGKRNWGFLFFGGVEQASTYLYYYLVVISIFGQRVSLHAVLDYEEMKTAESGGNGGEPDRSLARHGVSKETFQPQINKNDYVQHLSHLILRTPTVHYS
jgi:hypothetical protein